MPNAVLHGKDVQVMDGNAHISRDPHGERQQAHRVEAQFVTVHTCEQPEELYDGGDGKTSWLGVSSMK